MRNRHSEQQQHQQGNYLKMVNYGVLTSVWNEMRDCSMKDQKLYLISKQEQRVPFHLLTAVELSARLEEFVSCIMKLRATLKTSLLLLLELKAYPVNCSTQIVHVVVRFCKAKLSLDRFRLRGNNFMSTTEERSYWMTFLWRDLDASATLLQVGRDLCIKSLIQVVHLIHEPACTAFLRPQSLDISVEERRLLLSRPRLGAASEQETVFGSPLRKQPRQCLPGFNIDDIATVLFGNFTCQGSADISGRDWGQSVSPGTETGTETETVVQENSSSSGSQYQEHVMSLSELMRLESVVDTLHETDNLHDVVTRLSKEFHACRVTGSVCSSTHGSKHAARTIKSSHRCSKSWSFTASRSPANCATKGVVRFQIPPPIGEAESPVKESVAPSLKQVAMAGKSVRKSRETSSCTADARITDEILQYDSLRIKRGRKEKLFSALKAAARTLGVGYANGSDDGNNSKRKPLPSPHLDLSQIALSH